MKFLSAFLIAILLTTGACARSGGSPGNLASPGFTFRSTIGGTYATKYNWFGNQTIAASRAVAMGNGSPSRFPLSTIQWNIQPGDTPLQGLITERDEFLFALKGSPGYDVTAYGQTQCLAKSFYLPSDWTDSVAFLPEYPAPWFFAGQLHADSQVAPGINPPQAAFGWDIIAGHIYEKIWGGYASLGYSATNTNIDLGPYVKSQWMDIETCITFQAGTGVTGGSNGVVQVWTRTCAAGVAAPTPADCTASLAQKQISATNTGGAFVCTDINGSAASCSPIPTAWAQPDNTITPMYYKDGGYRDPQSFTQTYYSGPFVIAPTMQGAAQAAFGQYP